MNISPELKAKMIEFAKEKIKMATDHNIEIDDDWFSFEDGKDVYDINIYYYEDDDAFYDTAKLRAVVYNVKNNNTITHEFVRLLL